MTEIKPCPFCGGEASCEPSTYDDDTLPHEDQTPTSWGVGCSCTAFVGPWFTETEAIAAWNQRTPDPEALITGLREAREALAEFSREYDGFQDGNGDPCPTLVKARVTLAHLDSLLAGDK